MPIKTQGDLPVKEILERENIFVMDEKRAMHQDIRPIQILILNLMPLKEETELQLLRSLSNTPLQVDVTFMAVESHEAKNTSLSHLNKFYETFTDIKKSKFDGMIITGAPVEQMPFEEVDYWNELTEIMDWTEKHVTSTIFLCWAAQASLYHFYGLEKKPLDKKMFGHFPHFPRPPQGASGTSFAFLSASRILVPGSTRISFSSLINFIRYIFIPPMVTVKQKPLCRLCHAQTIQSGPFYFPLCCQSFCKNCCACCIF